MSRLLLRSLLILSPVALTILAKRNMRHYARHSTTKTGSRGEDRGALLNGCYCCCCGWDGTELHIAIAYILDTSRILDWFQLPTVNWWIGFLLSVLDSGFYCVPTQIGLILNWYRWMILNWYLCCWLYCHLVREALFGLSLILWLIGNWFIRIWLLLGLCYGWIAWFDCCWGLMVLLLCTTRSCYCIVITTVDSLIDCYCLMCCGFDCSMVLQIGLLMLKLLI